jgi:hypothetical protein
VYDIYMAISSVKFWLGSFHLIQWHRHWRTPANVNPASTQGWNGFDLFSWMMRSLTRALAILYNVISSAFDR